METHPVPQQISSYQFRLVGDMTLKQFFQIGGGALVSLLIYATGLHPIIKWPLILFSFSLGAALAFLPFEERPLSKWIFSFFRSVYSPTIYFWEKSQKPYEFFKEDAAVPKNEGIIAPHGEVVMNEYLKNRPEKQKDFLSKLEASEKNLLNKFTSLFNIPSTPTTSGNVSVKNVVKEGSFVKNKIKQDGTFKVPAQIASVISKKGFRPKIVVEEKPLKEVGFKQPLIQTSNVEPTLKTQETVAKSAEFSQAASPPNPPIIPNTVVGQVLSPEGKIIEGAILEIRDMAGRPVRALRSNKVGHFIIVTSLQNGRYNIITEKDGYEFDPATFEAKGEIIPPIVIRAKKNLNQETKIIN